MRSWTRVAGAALALAMVASCGGNKAETSEEAVPDSTAPPATTAANVTTGGEVVVGVEANPTTMDFVGGNGGPADSATGYVWSLLYEGLTSLGTDGAAQDALASSVEHNDDYTVWTAKVREGVTFADGAPVDAAAVVASYKFRADPANCRCSANYDGMTVEATDPMTVRFTLAEPRARLDTTRLTDPVVSPATLAAGVDRNKTPVGTGPFQLVDRDALTFERNAKYWRKDDKGRSLPYLDKVRLAPIPDPSVRLNALRKGEVQVIEATDGPTIKAATEDKSFTVDNSASGGVTAIVANMRSAKASDPEVRDALALAVDREALAQSYAGSSNVPAYSFFTEDFPFKLKGSFPKRDVPKAKKMVEDIRARLGPDALKLSIVCAKIPEAEALLPVALNQAREVGFDATLSFLDVGQYATQVLGTGGGGWDIACARTGPLDANPAELGNFVKSTSGSNAAKYSNPEVDKLFDQEQSAVDVAARTEIFQKVLDIIVKDKPYIPLLFIQVAAVARQGVEGVSTPDRVWPTHVDLTTLWLKAG